MNADFWRGRRVLITGHTGFKGSWLCLWLQRLGARVVGFALDPPTQPNLFLAADVANGMVSIHGDVRDHSHVTNVIREHDPDIVFHMAAQSVVRESYDAPVETYSTNVVGTACVLDALRAVPGRRAVVNVTTDKCYKNKEWLWGYRENDELGGRDPYSNSKACAELVTQSFRDSFFPPQETSVHGIGLASARAGNVIGGGDWTRDQLIPDVIRAFLADEPALIRRPNATRPWQHVIDCLSGYLLLAEHLARDPSSFSTGWNFGPKHGDVQTVSWIVERLVKAWGGNASWRVDAGHHPHEAGSLRLDSSQAADLLGWAPRLDLPRAVGWAAEWYKSHHAGKNAREICLQQLAEYERLLA